MRDRRHDVVTRQQGSALGGDFARNHDRPGVAALGIAKTPSRDAERTPRGVWSAEPHDLVVEHIATPGTGNRASFRVEGRLSVSVECGQAVTTVEVNERMLHALIGLVDDRDPVISGYENHAEIDGVQNLRDQLLLMLRAFEALPENERLLVEEHALRGEAAHAEVGPGRDNQHHDGQEKEGEAERRLLARGDHPPIGSPDEQVRREEACQSQ